MGAAAVRARVRRLKELIDGLRWETEQVQAGALGLTRRDNWNYRHRLHKAMGQLEDAQLVLSAALLRAEETAGEGPSR
jgi:hypothetical protein